MNTNISTATEVQALLKQAASETDTAAYEFETCGDSTNGDVPQGLINMHRAVGRAQVALVRAQIDIAAVYATSTADADRAKERERLIQAVIDGIRNWDKDESVAGFEVIRRALALAAFDAANGGNQG